MNELEEEGKALLNTAAPVSNACSNTWCVPEARLEPKLPNAEKPQSIRGHARSELNSGREAGADAPRPDSRMHMASARDRLQGHDGSEFDRVILPLGSLQPRRRLELGDIMISIAAGLRMIRRRGG